LSYNRNPVNAVRLQSDTNRKSVRIKSKVKKLSRGTNKNENENSTTAINAQGDTGANCSATDTIDIIHNYAEFTIPQEVGVFSEDESGTTLQARKLWTHSTKNKDSPIAYMDKFLKRHGIRTTNPSKAIVTTSGAGYLAKSRAFKETIREQRYVVQPRDDDIDFLEISFRIKWKQQYQQMEEEN
jgi:hypothetical protein